MVLRVQSELNPRDASKATRRGLREGVRLVADEIRRTTPVLTGTLRDSTYHRTRTVQRIPIGEAGWRDLQPKMLVLEFGGFANVGLIGSTGGFREGRFIITNAWNKTFPEAARVFGIEVGDAIEQVAIQTERNARRAEKRELNNLRNLRNRTARRRAAADAR